MQTRRPNKKSTTTAALAPAAPVLCWVAFAALAAAIVWSYWPVFLDMAYKWSHDPQYSHAYLVPLFSAFLIWQHRKTLAFAEASPCWWGLALLVAGVGIRLVGARYFVDWLEAISLLPILAGAVLLLGGMKSLRSSWVAIAFLGFMIPLPHILETGLSQPLQKVATQGATFALQTLGRPAFNEGNVIIINEARVGVIDACNGLGMFLLFFALATAVAIMIDRPLWEKVTVVLSAAPIAVGVNIVRVMANALAHELFESPKVDAFFHDFAGWLMMPLALLALWLELKLLAKVFIEVAPKQHHAERSVTARGQRAPRQESAISKAH